MQQTHKLDSKNRKMKKKKFYRIDYGSLNDELLLQLAKIERKTGMKERKKSIA
jgi:hypothetical protein